MIYYYDIIYYCDNMYSHCREYKGGDGRNLVIGLSVVENSAQV